jgi:chromate reductase
VTKKLSVTKLAEKLDKKKRDDEDVEPLEFLAICGSLREDSFNAALVRSLAALAPGNATITIAPSIGNLPHYDGDLEVASGVPASALTLGGMVRDADAIVIVSPEYNYSIPGVLKNALDWLSRIGGAPLAGKPALIQSISLGPVGGARMQPHLRQVLGAMGAHVFPRPEVAIGLAGQRFDEDGRLIDTTTRELVRKQLAEFAVFADRLVEREDED